MDEGRVAGRSAPDLRRARAISPEAVGEGRGGEELAAMGVDGGLGEEGEGYGRGDGGDGGGWEIDFGKGDY